MTEQERDRLDRAIDDLRAFARELPPEAAGTRRRVLAAERTGRRPRIKALLVAFGLLGVGAPALAHFTGTLPALGQALASWLGLTSQTQPEMGQRPPDQLEPAGALPPEPAPARPVPPPAADSSAGSALERPAIEPASKAKRPRAPAPQQSPGPAVSPDDKARALFLIAHRAHFDGGSAQDALRAWDAFLAAAPHDAFAPEARYNRAIALLKLARYEAALDALAPFACAAPGAYRQREASELIARARAQRPQLPAPNCERSKP